LGRRDGKYITKGGVVYCEYTSHKIVVTTEIFGGGFVDDISA
jgi:hypothetical protein